MKDIVRCAVLGLGRLGYWHARNLATKIEGAQLLCVADPADDKAEKTANELGLKKWTIDSDDVFADPEIDAVIVATPTSLHADMIKKAAQQHKHIFVEKPLTQHLEEADESVKVAQQHQVICQVGFMRRFDPAYAEAKRRILAGDIGEPIYFKGVSRDPGSPPPDYIKTSGGIFVDMSIHDYDIARFLMDAEVNSVSAHGKILVNHFMKEFNDVDQAITYLTFDTGAAGDIEGSRNAGYGYDIRGEVVGTEGTLVIGSLKYHDVHILTANGSIHDIVPSFPERFKDAYLHEMVHFIDCVSRGERPSVTEFDGMVALEIALAARKSFETGSRVSLNLSHKGRLATVRD